MVRFLLKSGLDGILEVFLLKRLHRRKQKIYILLDHDLRQHDYKSNMHDNRNCNEHESVILRNNSRHWSILT